MNQIITAAKGVIEEARNVARLKRYASELTNPALQEAFGNLDMAIANYDRVLLDEAKRRFPFGQEVTP